MTDNQTDQVAEHTSKIAETLLAIEASLKDLGLWEDVSPPESAFTSDQPFFIDTMEFTQWLQFVLLVRVSDIISFNLPLPASSQIHPMAEEYFRCRTENADSLIGHLKIFDELISQG
ncbi:MAG: YqcC family protein [Hahellaceae bacterium]|nr:YqcC family protein [Hahellaceae bacterium]MCP5213214.1 YqcC family protein [Hahellaceae bacterium]